MATKEWIEKNQDKMREYRRSYYHRNKESEKKRIYNRMRVIDSWFGEFKRKLSCVKCGESHISCLEFHHLDPSKKEYGIATMVTNGCGKETIMEEIMKCVVLCSNCHRKHHYRELRASDVTEA